MTSRRAIVASTLAGLGLASLGLPAGPARAAVQQPIWLDLQRAGQRLRLDITQTQGMAAAAWLLRDVQANNLVGQPAWPLLLRLAALQELVSQHQRYTVFEITSGLRTPATQRNIEGAAHHSNHLPNGNLQFAAVDFKPRGAQLADVHRLATGLPNVGLGLYSGHIHLDFRSTSARW